jgi:hypothetical protein
MRRGDGPVWVVVELMAEMIFNLLGGCLKQVIGIGGVGIDPVMDPGVVFGVVVGAQGHSPVVNAFNGAEGVEIALGNLGWDDLILILILILNCNGNVVCEVMPIRLDAIFKCLTVDVDTGVSGGLGDVAGEGVGDVFK